MMMSIKITGDYPDIQRIVTGFHSLDIALSNNVSKGIPLTIYDISGYSGVGKSTFVLSLAGILASAEKKNIAISPIEELDKTLMTSVLEMQGFDGEVHIELDSNDEKTIDALLEDIAKEDTSVGILDSVGAISPIAELEADSIADVNMGRRAQLMAKLSRHILHIQRFRKSPLSFFMISHLHAIIGGRGSITSGGVVKNYLSKVRIRLSRKEEFLKEGSYVLEGNVEKLSYGQGGRKFRVFCLAGRGLHAGLSAVIDCETLKIATRTNGVIKMGDTSYGRITKLIEDAHAGNDKVFKPFITALKDITIDTVSTDDEVIVEEEE
jgi:RecA/RadA recombinase